MLFKKLLPMAILGICLLNISCGDDDPCDGLNVPPGYLCEDGVLVDDPNGYCLRVVCPDGNCDEENDTCITSEACAGVTCADGTTLNVATCNCDQNAPSVEAVSGTISTNTTWTSNTIYELAAKVVVTSGTTLTIEPGTIIKGREGTGSLATALLIARGAKILAEGTAEEPIIFTSTLDNIQPGQITGTSLEELDNEKWGGLILLGNAPISAADGDTEALVEGIPPADGFGFYGGTDASDNSGVLRYVSVRHGGAEIGEGNEINGITLGGVGSGTVIENVEVVGNLDDGIECFGGTVDINNALVYFVGDDAIDIDQNYAGTIDNFVIVQGGGVGTDEALEIDGPEGSTYTEGHFNLKNGTIMSVDGEGSGADLKSKAQGSVTNTAWIGYEKFIKIRASYNDDCTNKSDALTNALEAKLVASGNQVVAPEGTDIVNVYESSELCDVPEEVQMQVDAGLAALGNTVVAEASFGADMTKFANWSWASANDKL